VLLRLGLLVIGPLVLAYYGMQAALLPLLIGVGFAALAVRVIGPWAVQVIGKTMANLANGPVTLLAGRRLADDPKGAFRPVAALVLQWIRHRLHLGVHAAGGGRPDLPRSAHRSGAADDPGVPDGGCVDGRQVLSVRALDQAGPARALRRSGCAVAGHRAVRSAGGRRTRDRVGLPVVGFGALSGLALSAEDHHAGQSGVLLLIGQVVVGLVLVAAAGTAGAPVLRKASAN
jgi:hypothetical protein